MAEKTNHEVETQPALPRGVRAASIARWILLALSILAAGWSLSMAFGLVGSHAHAAVQYHCPMHPTVVADYPADCPICGMDLVPIGSAGEGDDHHHEEHAWDSPEAIRQVAEQVGAEPGQWVCPMASCEHVADEPGTCPVCGMERMQVPENAPHADIGPAIYECPMHPEVRKEGPGKCPKCGMYLEKVGEGEAKADAHAHHGHEDHGDAAHTDPLEKKGVPGLSPVTIPSERLARIGVRTAPVERGSLEGLVRTVGVVAANEGQRNVVQTRFSGWIEELLVRETGTVVKKGQPLARIYSPELFQAQTEYLNALRWGGDLVAPARQRLELLGIADADVAAIRKAGKPLRSLTIRAPASGHVLHKGAVAGSFVSPGTILFEVADLSRVWVLADVYEQDIARVQLGTSASFAASSLPGDRFTGKVTFVYPTVDPGTRTMKVRLEIDNPDIALRPGMFGDVRLELPGRRGLIVPRDAVIETGDHVYSLVAKGGGRFEPREVHIQGRAGDHVMVEGLESGESVVTGAAFFIDSESRLRAALSGMAGGSTGGHDHGQAEVEP